MNRLLSSARISAVVVLLAGGLLLALARSPQRAADPWQVVISKPIVGLGWTAGTQYRQHEYLTAMFNQLDRDGLEPLMLQVMTQRAEGLANEDRLLVLCRPK